MHFARRRFLRAALALSCLLPLTRSAQPSPGSTSLVVTGSVTMHPLMIDIAKRFESLNPGTGIEVRGAATGRGIAELRAGLADIAMVSRGLNENEHDLFAFSLCRDGAAILVHRSNPLKSLNSRQLAEILTGKVADWKTLTPRAGAVKLAWRSAGVAIPDLLLQHLRLKPEEIRSHTTVLNNVHAVKFVAADPNAITVVALAVAERAAKAGMPVKLLAYEGVPASTRTVRERIYMLSRPLLLAVRSMPSGLQKQFIDYAVSDAVVDLQEKHGFVAY